MLRMSMDGVGADIVPPIAQLVMQLYDERDMDGFENGRNLLLVCNRLPTSMAFWGR